MKDSKRETNAAVFRYLLYKDSLLLLIVMVSTLSLYDHHVCLTLNHSTLRTSHVEKVLEKRIYQLEQFG